MITQDEIESFENVIERLKYNTEKNSINYNLLTIDASLFWYNTMPKSTLSVKEQLLKDEINNIKNIYRTIAKKDISAVKICLDAYENINNKIVYNINNTIDTLETNAWEYNFEYQVSVDPKEIKQLKKDLLKNWEKSYKKIQEKITKQDINIDTFDIAYKNEDILLHFCLETGKKINNFMKINIHEKLKTNKKYQEIAQKYTSWEIVLHKTQELNNNLYPSALEIELSDDDKIYTVKAKHNNEWKEIRDNNYEKHYAIYEYLKNVIKTDFKKHPMIGKKMANFASFDRENIEIVFSLMGKIKNNMDVLKSENINILDEIKKESIFIEVLDDRLELLILKHKTNNLMKGIVSNKYKHLIKDNNIAYDTFKEFVGLNLSKEDIQKEIGTKLARYKTPEEFNEGIQGILNVFNGFNLNEIEEKTKKLETRIIHKDIKNNNLLIEIEDYKASKILGSQSWCISYSENFFKKYKGKNNKQYFFYDFNKTSEDNKSMIGITVDVNNKIIHSYDKHDFSIEENDETIKMLTEIIKPKKNKFKKSILNNK